MQHIKHIIISAAGIGSRLGLNMPKCLVEVGGKKIIEHQLELFKDFEDLRVVVGFKEEEVINVVKNIRPDAVFVRNKNYSTSSNCHSVYLATKDLKEPHIIVDGDMIISPSGFKDFIKECKKAKYNIIGISDSKSEDAVFVDVDKKNVLKFNRIRKTKYEWCGIALLYNIKILDSDKYIYNQLEKVLPERFFYIDCYEIDTPQDLQNILNKNLTDLF